MVFVAAMFAAAPAAAHHPTGININAVCAEDIVVTVGYGDFGDKHYMDWDVEWTRDTGKAIFGGTPSGSFTPTGTGREVVWTKSPVSNGAWVVTTTAQARYPNGEAEGRPMVESIKFTCNEQTSDPRARILGPCGDPMYGAVLNNRRSTVANGYKVIRTGHDGRVVGKFNVERSNKKIVGPFYATPGTMIKVKSGGVLLAKERAAKGGNYGWASGECQLLR
jgi:hypothetical protein